MRMLDRLLGVPVLHGLAFTRKRRPLPDNPAIIGVIIPTAIGDTVLCSGVLRALVDRYPHAQLVVFCGNTNRAAVGLLPFAVKIVQCVFTKPADTLRRMRAEKLDLIVDLTPWTRMTAIYARLSAPVAVGFDAKAQHRAAAFDVAVPHDAGAHEIENHALVAAQFSNRPYAEEVTSKAFDVPDGVDLDRLVLFHSAAGGTRAADKAWPPERWAELARRLVAQGFQVGMTGAPADASLVESILDLADLARADAMSLCGLMNLGQLVDLLTRVRLLITIDTGVLHLASAANGHILALHGPTRSRRWGARTPNAVSLDSSHPAAGYICYGYETHADGGATMLEHSVNQVFAAAMAKLGSQGAAGSF